LKTFPLFLFLSFILSTTTVVAQNPWRTDPFMGAPSLIFWGDSVTHIHPKIKIVQKRRYHNTTELGIMVGGSSYQGDLIKARFDPRMTSPAFALLARYHVSPKFAFTLGFTGGTIIGGVGPNAAISNGRSMKANFREAYGRAEWYPIGKKLKNEAKSGIIFPMPYLFAGLGYGVSHPEVFLNRELQDSEGGKSSGFLSMPLGAGLRLKLPDEFTIGAEIGLRFTNTDYLDGVSKLGNSNNRDTYVVAGFYAMYMFD
jgi:Domain of unknown function (DUF6089)